jgi:alpha-tubulin suppressor-like RCC1 family protein
MNDPDALIRIRLSDHKERIKKVDSGSFHSVILTESGKVYSGGDRAEGKLGRQCTSQDDFKTIQSLSTIKIKDIHCGSDYVIAQSYDNTVHCFGTDNPGHHITNFFDIMTPAEKPFTISTGRFHIAVTTGKFTDTVG